MMWLFMLLIVGPLIELYTAIQVAHAIGGWNTIALLILVGMAGSYLLKRQGLTILDRVRTATAEGRVPDKELVDGLFLAIAAGLMIAPGFVSDVVAIALLLPPVRAVLRPFVLKRVGGGGRSRVTVIDSRHVGTFRAGRPGVYDVDGHDTTVRTDRQIEP